MDLTPLQDQKPPARDHEVARRNRWGRKKVKLDDWYEGTLGPEVFNMATPPATSRSSPSGSDVESYTAASGSAASNEWQLVNDGSASADIANGGWADTKAQ